MVFFAFPSGGFMTEAINIIGVLRYALRGNKGHLAFAEPSGGILAKQTIKSKTINALYVRAYFVPPSNNRLKLTAHLTRILSARSLA